MFSNNAQRFSYSTVKVTLMVVITVTVSVRYYKVAYASFQAGRRPARKLVVIKGKGLI